MPCPVCGEPLSGLRAYGEGEEAPKEAEDEPNLEPNHLTVDLESDQGPLVLRRILFAGAPDVLEFTLPSGALYPFPFREWRG